MRAPSLAVSAVRAAFRNKNIRRAQLSWGAAIAAEWAHFVALGVFAYRVGGTSAVGIAGLVRLLPAAVVAPSDRGYTGSRRGRVRRGRSAPHLRRVGPALRSSRGLVRGSEGSRLCVRRSRRRRLDAFSTGSAGVAPVTRTHVRGTNCLERGNVDGRELRHAPWATVRWRARCPRQRRVRLRQWGRSLACRGSPRHSRPH